MTPSSNQGNHSVVKTTIPHHLTTLIDVVVVKVRECIMECAIDYCMYSLRHGQKGRVYVLIVFK